MSTSVRLSAPADPALMKTLEEPFTGAEAKRLHFSMGASRGFQGPDEAARFPFRLLRNQALMFIFSFIREPGAGGECSGRTTFILMSVRWVDLGAGEMSAR